MKIDERYRALNTIIEALDCMRRYTSKTANETFCYLETEELACVKELYSYIEKDLEYFKERYNGVLY